MSLRLLKILIPESSRGEVLDVLDEFEYVVHWCTPVDDGRLLMDVVLPGEGNEPVLDALESRMGRQDGFRLTLVPVQATIPRIEEPESDAEDDTSDSEDDPQEKAERVHARINREELYAGISDTSEATPYYLVMVALSAVVASVGLLMGDTAVIIGAMVIAPLLGPNMALAFATTLGDVELGVSAFRASAVGAAVAFAVAVLLGVIFIVDPEGGEIASRTQVGFGNIALALAAGSAGALSLTRGVATGLVGVMVAVALLPPLSAAGLLIGAGWWNLGMGALSLVLANLACVNLAGIGTFLAQGVRPLSWWDERRAKKATTVAIVLWTCLLAVLMGLIWMAWEG